jgi:hypothetical protein
MLHFFGLVYILHWQKPKQAECKGIYFWFAEPRDCLCSRQLVGWSCMSCWLLSCWRTLCWLFRHGEEHHFHFDRQWSSQLFLWHCNATTLEAPVQAGACLSAPCSWLASPLAIYSAAGLPGASWADGGRPTGNSRQPRQLVCARCEQVIAEVGRGGIGAGSVWIWCASAIQAGRQLALVSVLEHLAHFTRPIITVTIKCTF